MKRIFSGVGASPGIGIGNVLTYRETQLYCEDKPVTNVKAELERYREAVTEFCLRNEKRAHHIAVAAGQKQAEIIHSQAVMANDPYLKGQVEGRIAARQCAEGAVNAVCELFIDTFSTSDNELLQQRAADVQDLRNGLLRILLGLPDVDFSDLKPGTVLVSEELSPSAISELDPSKMAGVVLRTGGRMSHCAILARAMEIPVVVGVPDLQYSTCDGELVVVDGTEGKVYTGLSDAEVAGWEKQRREYGRLRESLRSYQGCDTVNADGERVLLDANVGNENDVLRAEELGCDGVGLFRSEFLYQERDSLPDEDAQFQVYRRMALAMKGRPLIIRSLDSGGDKELPYLKREKEENPQLGCRAIRLCLREEEMFLAQLKAVLRAGAFGDVRLMLPLVTGAGEVREAKRLMKIAKEQLFAEKLPFREDLPLGITVETAAAAMIADILAEEADFFSIGTNDLTQYVMAADRQNSQVAYLYSYYDPAVLRSIRRIVDCGKAAGIPVGMCGEAAADPLLLPVLLSFEFDELSVDPVSILSTRKAISKWTKAAADRITAKVMRMKTEEEIRTFLQESSRI